MKCSSRSGQRENCEIAPTMVLQQVVSQSCQSRSDLLLQINNLTVLHYLSVERSIARLNSVKRIHVIKEEIPSS